MLAAPTFNLPPESKSQGGDPLGLEAPNLRLMGSVLSGMNNTVRYVRVYALLCWACWQAKRYCDTSGIAIASPESRVLFRNMLEKVQLVITWAHIELKDSVQLVGLRAPKFPTGDGPAQLTLSAFGIGGEVYMDPGQYRPSVVTYFGFLRGVGVWMCTDECGLALAHAMEASLAKSPLHAWLANPTALTATRQEVQSLLPFIDLRAPTPLEQAAFRQRLIPDTADPEETDLDANRRAGMLLVLRACNEIASGQVREGLPVVGATEEEIRATMAVGKAPDGTPFNLDGIASAQAKWAVLQLRQYQRTCYEAIYTCVHQALSEDLEPEERSTDKPW